MEATLDELDPEQKLLPLSRLIVQEVISRLREDGVVFSAGAIATAQSSDDREERIALKEAAQMLGHSYCWLSRNYMRLGLRPSRIGAKLIFERNEIDRLLAEKKVRRAGRPRLVRFGK